MRRALLAGAVALAAVGAAPAGAQQPAYRFAVDSVTDSTFVIPIGASAAWVKRGTVGVAVDPRRRDALVARFRVLEVDGGRARVLVTGQTTFVTTEHVALLDPPPPRLWRSASFWAGIVLGAAAGLGGVLALGG